MSGYSLKSFGISQGMIRYTIGTPTGDITGKCSYTDPEKKKTELMEWVHLQNSSEPLTKKQKRWAEVGDL